MESKDCDLSIMSFNILVDNYCTSRYYCDASKNAVDNKIRYQLLLKKLKEKIEMTDCFCLQEVTRIMANKLCVWFDENEFDSVFDNYGYIANGYMGIMIAWKRMKYKRIEQYSENIGDNINVEIIEKPYSTIDKIWEWLGYKMINKESNSLSIAKKRQNILLAVKLKSNDGKIVWVANYHMPCVFWDPVVMMYHTERVYKVITDLSEKHQTLSQTDCPVVLCTDLNSIPGSDVYRYFTNTTQGFKSAYFEMNNCEPKATNYTITRNRFKKDDTIDTFKGCLDYCFYTKLTPVKANITDCSVPMPNDTWPSDHVMLNVGFNFNV